MAITLADLETLLSEADLKHQAMPEHDAVMVGFNVDPSCSYRDSDGDPSVLLVLRLDEEGEFLSAFSPACWTISDADHRPAVSEVLISLQSRFKFVRYDLASDFVIPNVEVAIENGTITSEQLQRILGALVQAIKTFDPAVRRAIDTGVVLLDEPPDEREALPPTGHPADDVRQLLRLVDEAGGIDGAGIEALERLLGGDGDSTLEL